MGPVVGPVMDAVAEAAVVAHLVSAAAYAGFQWTVRVVVYPQLASAAATPGGAAGFPALEASHSRRVSRLVGPLLVALVVSTAGALAASWGSSGALAAGGAAACTGVVLAVTAFGAVPQHRALGRGWDPASHRRLVRWDDVRVVAATAQLVLAVVLVAALP